MKQSIYFSACVCLILSVFMAGRAQKPYLVVQTGHSQSVYSVAFSPDGKTLASGSVDSTIKLWDVSTGTELRTLKGHSKSVKSVAFSPNGKTLASGGYDGIKLWDVPSGAELYTLKAHFDVSSVAFSPDGKTLVIGDGFRKTVKLWDVSTGIELRTLRGHSFGVDSVAFSPDGKTVASGSADMTAKLWDAATGAELHTLKGHPNSVVSVAFSPDGKTLACASHRTIKLWDVSKATELRTLHGLSGNVSSVAFSPDGKTLVSGDGLDKTVRLWDVSTGAELRALKGHSYAVNSVAFSPDGKNLASGSNDNTVKIWDVSTGAELRTLGGHSGSSGTVAFSPDGKTLRAGNKLWDISTGSELRTLKVYPSAVSPDAKTFAIRSDADTIKFWDVSTGSELRTLKAFGFTTVSFSPDSKTLATGSEDIDGDDNDDRNYYIIKLWDVSTGKELHTLKRHSQVVSDVEFSPDGKILASSGHDAYIKLWDVPTGSELRILDGHSPTGFYGGPVAFSPDGKTLAIGSESLPLWDVSTGVELRTFKGHSGSVVSIAFSPDGKSLASGSEDDSVKVWEIASGRELHTLKAHSSAVTSVTFSPDGKTLASGGNDGRVNLWNVSSGDNLASLIALDQDDWLVVTPDGLFDGSPAAWNKILWRFNNNTFDYASVEAYFSEFYYPGLLTDIFAGKRPKALTDISQKDRRQPQLKLTMIERQSGPMFTTRNVGVKIDVTQAPAGAQDVRLFRNGSLVEVWHGDVLKGQNVVVLEATIPIIAGENRLTAYAFNRDNIKSSDATLVVNGADSLKRQGTAYILAVGVNRYSNRGYNLKYAVADAEEFSAEVKRRMKALKRYAEVAVIPLYDAQATKANIIQSLTRLTSRVQPEDAVIVYFAGHGMALQNRFYLIPHDLGYTGPRARINEAGLQSMRTHSISDLELDQAFEKMDAGQILLVIDACNSGQALEAEEKRRGPMNSKGLAQLAYEKGMYILTAAQSYQAAQEAKKLGHGFLTYALVEDGLKRGAADGEPKDGRIELREWLNYATDQVPRMQEENSLEALRGRGRLINFAGDGTGARGPGQSGVQRPRIFYRRGLESNPLVVAILGATPPK